MTSKIIRQEIHNSHLLTTALDGETLSLAAFGCAGKLSAEQHRVAALTEKLEDEITAIKYLGDIVYPDGVPTDPDEASEVIEKFLLNVYGNIDRQICLVLGNHESHCHKANVYNILGAVGGYFLGIEQAKQKADAFFEGVKRFNEKYVYVPWQDYIEELRESLNLETVRSIVDRLQIAGAAPAYINIFQSWGVHVSLDEITEKLQTLYNRVTVKQGDNFAPKFLMPSRYYLEIVFGKKGTDSEDEDEDEDEESLLRKQITFMGDPDEFPLAAIFHLDSSLLQADAEQQLWLTKANEWVNENFVSIPHKLIMAHHLMDTPDKRGISAYDRATYPYPDYSAIGGPSTKEILLINSGKLHGTQHQWFERSLRMCGLNLHEFHVYGAHIHTSAEFENEERFISRKLQQITPRFQGAYGNSGATSNKDPKVFVSPQPGLSRTETGYELNVLTYATEGFTRQVYDCDVSEVQQENNQAIVPVDTKTYFTSGKLVSHADRDHVGQQHWGTYLVPELIQKQKIWFDTIFAALRLPELSIHLLKFIINNNEKYQHDLVTQQIPINFDDLFDQALSAESQSCTMDTQAAAAATTDTMEILYDLSIKTQIRAFVVALENMIAEYKAPDQWYEGKLYHLKGFYNQLGALHLVLSHINIYLQGRYIDMPQENYKYKVQMLLSPESFNQAVNSTYHLLYNEYSNRRGHRIFYDPAQTKLQQKALALGRVLTLDEFDDELSSDDESDDENIMDAVQGREKGLRYEYAVRLQELALSQKQVLSAERQMKERELFFKDDQEKLIDDDPMELHVEQATVDPSDFRLVKRALGSHNKQIIFYNEQGDQIRNETAHEYLLDCVSYAARLYFKRLYGARSFPDIKSNLQEHSKAARVILLLGLIPTAEQPELVIKAFLDEAKDMSQFRCLLLRLFASEQERLFDVPLTDQELGYFEREFFKYFRDKEDEHKLKREAKIAVIREHFDSLNIQSEPIFSKDSAMELMSNQPIREAVLSLSGVNHILDIAALSSKLRTILFLLKEKNTYFYKARHWAASWCACFSNVRGHWTFEHAAQVTQKFLAIVSASPDKITCIQQLNEHLPGFNYGIAHYSLDPYNQISLDIETGLISDDGIDESAALMNHNPPTDELHISLFAFLDCLPNEQESFQTIRDTVMQEHQKNYTDLDDLSNEWEFIQEVEYTSNASMVELAEMFNQLVDDESSTQKDLGRSLLTIQIN